MPEQMMVYKVKRPENITDAYAREIARKYFDLPADARLTRSSGMGLYWLKTSTHRFELEPRTGFFNLRKLKWPESWDFKKEDYPSSAECLRIATEYLKRRNLLPEDASPGNVVDNTSSGKMSVGFGRIIDGYKSWGAGARVLVHIGGDREILSVLKQWQELAPYRVYPIKGPAQALEELKLGKADVLRRKGRVTEITLRYQTAPDDDYVLPIYYFNCVDGEGDFYGVVPALKAEYVKSAKEMQEIMQEKLKRDTNSAPQ